MSQRVIPPMLAVALLLGALAGCGVLEPAGHVAIRIANDSEVDFDEVVVGFPSQMEPYGAVAAGARTGYHVVPRAYGYAYIEVHAGADTVILQPVDYVGESLLRPGRYTYALDMDPSGPTLSLSLEDDR